MIVKAWVELNSMNIIWKSYLSSCLKINVFISTVEYVRVYSCVTWTLVREND